MLRIRSRVALSSQRSLMSFGLIALGVAACSIPDRTLLPEGASASAGVSGSAGSGGTAGTAGNAGVAGNAGNAGNAGSSGGGAGGTSSTVKKLACDPTVYWKLDGDGTNAMNPGAHALTFQGDQATWFTPAESPDSLLNRSLGVPPNTALSPPSCTDCSAEAALRFVGAVSAQVWVRPGPATVATKLDLLSMAVNTNDQAQAGGWVLRIDDPGSNTGLDPQLCAQGGFLCQGTNGQGTFSRGNWTHLVFTIAPSNIPGGQTFDYKLYVDGVQRLATPFTGTKLGPPPDGTTPLLVGALTSSAVTYSGVLDEIAIWGCTLPSSDVSELYNRKFAWAP